MRRTILAVVLAVCVVVSGCAGLGASDSDETGAQAEPQSLDRATEAAGAADGERSAQRVQAGFQGGNGGDGSDDGVLAVTPGAVQEDRVVIKEGELTLEVSNFSTARTNIERAVEGHGGYVADSSLQRHQSHNQTWHTGQLVLRVPAKNFSAVRAAVVAEGTVERVDVGTTDVTEQLVDLNARLENLERERDRLREFMDRANDTEDLIAIEERLSEVQGEIERLEAQRRTLLDRVAYSTLRVQLAEPQPEPVAAEEEGMPPLGEVFMNSVEDVLTAGQWLLVTTVALVPWAIALGIPAGLAAVVVRWRRPSAWRRTVPGGHGRSDREGYGEVSPVEPSEGEAADSEAAADESGDGGRAADESDDAGADDPSNGDRT